MTLRLRGGLPNLRKKRAHRAVREAIRLAQDRKGCRVVHWSVQSNHLHLLVEATDRVSLSRGMQGLKIRMAKALNRIWGRAGAVFSDRYHNRTLRTPREVRNALLYVLNNFRKHEAQRGRWLSPGFLDPCSTAEFFDGWRGRKPSPLASLVPWAPRSWLLRVGWRKAGLLDPAALPLTD